MPIERARKLGNPTRRPLPAPVEIEVVAQIPDAPKHLLTAGKRLWGTVHTFASRWVDGKLDMTVLLMACELADDRERMKRRLKIEGHFQKIPLSNAKGEIIGEEIKVHPARRELRADDAMLLKMLAVLGLTPTDRSRLKLTEAQAENEFDKWLKATSA